MEGVVRVPGSTNSLVRPRIPMQNRIQLNEHIVTTSIFPFIKIIDNHVKMFASQISKITSSQVGHVALKSTTIFFFSLSWRRSRRGTRRFPSPWRCRFPRWGTRVRPSRRCRPRTAAWSPGSQASTTPCRQRTAAWSPGEQGSTTPCRRAALLAWET